MHDAYFDQNSSNHMLFKVNLKMPLIFKELKYYHFLIIFLCIMHSKIYLQCFNNTTESVLSWISICITRV